MRDIKNRNSGGHIQNAHHRYVGELSSNLDEIPRDKTLVIYCDAGYKGNQAASILALHNYRDITNVHEGMTAWKQAGSSVEKSQKELLLFSTELTRFIFFVWERRSL